MEVELLVLADGSSVVIRPLAVGDEAGIASWFTRCFAGLSAATLHARLFVLLEWLDRFAEPARWVWIGSLPMHSRCSPLMG